jgi:polysaccharide biosynthesis/export protein
LVSAGRHPTPPPNYRDEQGAELADGCLSKVDPMLVSRSTSLLQGRSWLGSQRRVGRWLPRISRPRLSDRPSVSLRAVLAITGLLALGSPRLVSAQQSVGPPAKEAEPVLQPGDLVRLRIWREPDLSGDYRLDEDGVAVFPKIGPLPVSRLSTDSLKTLLLSNYNQFLQNPAIEVTFLRRINVLGEVKSPGLYDVDPTMTVADVVARAGGVTPDGNSKKIELLRHGGGKSTRISSESRLADSPLRSGDQLRVPQRSWLSRNGTVVAAGITAVAIIATAALR